MNALSGDNLLKPDDLKPRSRRATARSQILTSKDTQVMNIHNARRYIGDRLIRTASRHRILDPAHGPLIAVKLNILTRRTLGGFEDRSRLPRVRQRREHQCRGSMRRRGGRFRRRRMHG